LVSELDAKMLAHAVRAVASVSSIKGGGTRSVDGGVYGLVVCVSCRMNLQIEDHAAYLSAFLIVSLTVLTFDGDLSSYRVLVWECLWYSLSALGSGWIF
jgi:hypothetical protein